MLIGGGVKGGYESGYEGVLASGYEGVFASGYEGVLASVFEGVDDDALVSAARQGLVDHPPVYFYPPHWQIESRCGCWCDCIRCK